LTLHQRRGNWAGRKCQSRDKREECESYSTARVLFKVGQLEQHEKLATLNEKAGAAEEKQAPSTEELLRKPSNSEVINSLEESRKNSVWSGQKTKSTSAE